MSYTLTHADDSSYILLTVKGEINRKTALQQNQESHAFGKKLGINRYLVDLTGARNTDSIPDQYDFAYRDMQQTEGIDRFARVAVLISSGDHSHNFIETVARNSGLNVKIFTDLGLAKEFLKE